MWAFEGGYGKYLADVWKKKFFWAEEKRIKQKTQIYRISNKMLQTENINQLGIFFFLTNKVVKGE